MPRDRWVPSRQGPCPTCGADLAGGRCGHCGLVLTGDEIAALTRIDDQLRRLAAERQAVVARIGARRWPPAPPGPAWPAPAALPPLPSLPPQTRGPEPVRRLTSVTLPNLLLGLGTGLTIVAAVVFATVRWSDLRAGVQALILASLTAGTGWACVALRRRGLAGTAEAASVIMVALLLADLQATRVAAPAFLWRGGPGDEVLSWCAGLAIVAGFAWWFGRFSDTRAPRVIAAVAAQVPVPLYLGARGPVGPAVALALCLAQAALVLAAVRHTPRAPAGARVAAAAVAVGTWVTVLPLALALDPSGSAAVLALAAAVAGLAAGLWADDPTVRPAALGAATLVGLGAAGRALGDHLTRGTVWAALATACVAVLAVGARVPRRWGEPPLAVAAVAGALASWPVIEWEREAVAVATTVPATAWRHGALSRVATLTDVPLGSRAPGLGLAYLAVLVAAVVALAPRLGRRGVVAGGAAIAGTVAIAAPVAGDLAVVAVVALCLMAAGAAGAWLARPGATRAGAPVHPAVPVASLAGFGALAVLWGAAAPATTLLAVGAVALLATSLVMGAGRDEVAALAVPGAVVAAGAGVGEVAAATGAAGAPGSSVWVATGLAAAALVPVTALARTRARGSAVAGRAITAVVATAAALAAAALAGLAGEDGRPAAFAVVVGGIAVAAGWLAARAARDADLHLARFAVPALVVAASAEAGLVAAVLGAPDGGAWLLAGLVAAGATLAAAAADPAGEGTAGGIRGDLARLGEATGAAVHLVALAEVAGLAGTGAVSALLATGAAVAAVHALRPGRRWAVAWAAGEALALIWVRLAVADVHVPEAYTAPVAAVFVAAAAVTETRRMARQFPSWTVHGPWLVVAVAPTAWLALTDPGLVRPLGGLAAGVAVLVGGALTRRRAAVDVGAVTVVALGLRQLAPLVAQLPNWVTLGTCGLVLLVVGATFEDRRRDLTTVADRYSSLL